jgi:hypothetical protein
MVNDGTSFEHKVAMWARRHYEGSVQERLLVNGLTKRPFEVDIRVNIPGIFSANDIWIECKDRHERIKAANVRSLVGKAKDVFQACATGKEDFYFNRLVIVSSSPFEGDALVLANIEGVECFLYDGKRYIQQNSRKITFNEKWLRDTKATM